MTGGDLTQAVATYKTTQANKKHYPENLDSSELGLTTALDSMQGTREEQEDAHILKVNDDKKFAVFAVFDGHGGSQVSKWLETNFNNKLVGAKFKIDGDLNAQKKFFKQLYIKNYLTMSMKNKIYLSQSKFFYLGKNILFKLFIMVGIVNYGSGNIYAISNIYKQLNITNII